MSSALLAMRAIGVVSRPPEKQFRGIESSVHDLTRIDAESRPGDMSLEIAENAPYSSSFGFEVVPTTRSLVRIPGSVNIPMILGFCHIIFDREAPDDGKFERLGDTFVMTIAPSSRSFSLKFPLNIGLVAKSPLAEVVYLFDQRTLGDRKTHSVGWRAFLKPAGGATTAEEARRNLENIRLQAEARDQEFSLPELETEGSSEPETNWEKQLETLFSEKGPLVSNEDKAEPQSEPPGPEVAELLAEMKEMRLELADAKASRDQERVLEATNAELSAQLAAAHDLLSAYSQAADALHPRVSSIASILERINDRY